MRNKIALRVIRTAVKFFASSLRFPCDDLSVAAGHRALRKRDRTRVAAFGKSRTGEKVSEAAEFFDHGLSAFFAHDIGFFVEKAFDAFLRFHHVVDAFFERAVKIFYHPVPHESALLHFVEIVFDFRGKMFVDDVRK